MSFEEQSSRAKALTRGFRKNYEWNQYRGVETPLYGNRFYDYQLKKGFDLAYKSPDGYAILRNPVSGQNEMFVRGTKTKVEWLANAAEAVPDALSGFVPALSPLQSTSFAVRKAYAKKLDSVAKQKGVKVVYGHSRGAAVVSDMTSNITKVGVDGAMLLAKRGRRSFVNYRQSQWFDRSIGYGESRRVVRGSSWKPWKRTFHKVYEY